MAQELGNFDNPMFEAMNQDFQPETQRPKIPLRYIMKIEVGGHGAAERTYKDPDTGELYLDM